MAKEGWFSCRTCGAQYFWAYQLREHNRRRRHE